MAAGPEVWAALQAWPTAPLLEGSKARGHVEAHLVPSGEVKLYLPFRRASHTDFHTGRPHATDLGTMFPGPGNASPPNWLHSPIAYNERASSVVA